MMARYVLRDLPGVAELEARLRRIAEHPSPLWAPEGDTLQADLDRLSRQIFGITLEDTLRPDTAGMTEAEAEHAHEAHDQHFAFLYHSAEEDEETHILTYAPEAEVIWDAMGWDVTDGEGTVLRAASHLDRQIVSVAKGLCGHLPGETQEMSQQEAEDLAARLRLEAAKFRRGK